MYRAGDVLGACKKELARTGGAVQTAMREAAASRLKAKGLGRTRATTTKGIPPRDDSLQEEEGAEDVPVQRKAKVSKKADLVADDLKGFGFKRLMTAPTPEIDRLTALHRLRNGAPKAEAVRSLGEEREALASQARVIERSKQTLVDALHRRDALRSRHAY